MQLKSYTDLEQSKKLAEILPLESADMCYIPIMDIDSMSNSGFLEIPEFYSYSDTMNWHADYLPCWSLAALRNLLPVGIKVNENTYLFESHNTFDKSWVYRYYNEEGYSYLYTKEMNEIDACYELILMLHKLNLL